jgi:hypothetical protein
MTNPFIQIDDEVRQMTDKEHEALIASGWTMEPKTPTQNADDTALEEEP